MLTSMIAPLMLGPRSALEAMWLDLEAQSREHWSIHNESMSVTADSCIFS
jgi:hypothetical protein